MMTGADIAQLKAYVQAPDSGMQNREAATVLLHVSHSNLSARFMEIRVDMHVSCCWPVATMPNLRAAAHHCHATAGGQNSINLSRPSDTDRILC